MPNVSFQAPTEYQIEADDIARRRKYAEALQAQSMQAPETQVVGGWAIPNSPTQGLGRLAQALASRRGLERATAEQRTLADKYNTEHGSALAAALRAGQGSPATSEQIVDETANGGEGAPATINAPAVPGSRQAMIAALTGSKFPDLQSAGMTQALSDMKPMVVGKSIMTPTGQVIGSDPTWAAEHEADRKAKAETSQLQREQRQRELEMRLEDQRLGREDRAALARELAEMRAQSSRELKSLVSASVPVTPVTIQDPNNPNATIVIDGRTRQPFGAGPKLSATGSAEQKLQLGLPQAKLRVDSMSQNLDKLDEALTTLDKDPGLTNITGTVMGRTPNLTNKATGAQAQLNSAKSQIFQSSLQAMREASKTGGAVGNVSDKEGDKLERTLAALDQAQSTPDFRKQLQKAVQQVRLSKQLIQTAFEEQYGGVQGRNSSVPAPGGSGGLSPAEQAELDQLRGRFGKKP